jgi:predicted O-methyltransferase YrrM
MPDAYLRKDHSDPKTSYIRSLFAQEDKSLAEIIHHLPADVTQMQMGAEEGKLLQMLVRLSGAKKIVEIGTLGGYSAIWMARALPEDGRLITIDHSMARKTLIQDNLAACGVDAKVSLRIGEALEVLAAIEGEGPFDMVIIDADKRSYLHYLDWAEKNLSSGGMIIGDNTLLFGSVYEEDSEKWPERVKEESWNVMREFNKRLADQTRYHSLMLPTDEGMTVAIKR